MSRVLLNFSEFFVQQQGGVGGLLGVFVVFLPFVGMFPLLFVLEACIGFLLCFLLGIFLFLLGCELAFC